MKSYIATFTATVLMVFMAAWAIIVYDYGKIAFPDYWLWRPHGQMIAACDVGSIDVLGNSTAIANIIPSRIGPGVRDFGFNGGSPIEAYYIAQSILRCEHKPKAVIVSFVPGELSAVHQKGVEPYFWGAFKFKIVDFSDALEVLQVSRKFGDTTIAGPQSLFDFDYRIKAFLYSIKFPPYYSGDIEGYISGRVQRDPKTNRVMNQTIYYQTAFDDGHHFIGTKSEGTKLDDDVGRTGGLIAPVEDYYLKRMVEIFGRNGIEVYFVEPPRDRISFLQYQPTLADEYQGYLMKLEGEEPNFHVIDNGFKVWEPALFGDQSHLNLRGALVLSGNLHNELGAAGADGLTYPEGELKPDNLYAMERPDTVFWNEPGAGGAVATSPASNISLPDLAYPGDSAWLYKISDAGDGDDGAGIQAPDIGLDAKTNYASSVFIKNIDAAKAGLRLVWPGGMKGSVTWDFGQHRISYSGTANSLNSGVTLCPGGWVQLFISGMTGPNAGPYAGPMISLPGSSDGAVYVYNPSLEKGLWPTNYCTLQPGEATNLPLVQKTAGAS